MFVKPLVAQHAVRVDVQHVDEQTQRVVQHAVRDVQLVGEQGQHVAQHAVGDVQLVGQHVDDGRNSGIDNKLLSMNLSAGAQIADKIHLAHVLDPVKPAEEIVKVSQGQGDLINAAKPWSNGLQFTSVCFFP